MSLRERVARAIYNVEFDEVPGAPDYRACLTQADAAIVAVLDALREQDRQGDPRLEHERVRWLYEVLAREECHRRKLDPDELDPKTGEKRWRMAGYEAARRLGGW